MFSYISLLSNFGVDWKVPTVDKIMDEKNYKMTVLINEYGFLAMIQLILRKSFSAKAEELRGNRGNI